MIKTFKRFELLPFSPSRINNWIDDKAGFVLRYIYKYDFAPSCAMIRGNAIEYGFSLYFQKKYKNIVRMCRARKFIYSVFFIIWFYFIIRISIR